MRGFQTDDQVHIHPGVGSREGDGKIRREVFKQLTKFTYFLKTDEEKKDEIIRREVFKQLTKFTYELETDEEKEMG
jgi:hypothetical protein